MAARRAERSAKISSMLDSFNVEQVPHFSKVILVASPVLLVMHLESGEAVPLPVVSAGALGSPNATRTSLVRTSSPGRPNKGDDQGSASESALLPEAIQSLLRDHKRLAFSLFRRWEQKGQYTVPLGVFADSMVQVFGIELSDEDLLAVLQAVDPVQGSAVDLRSHQKWRNRLIDTQRLWRRLHSASSLLRSQYIHESHPGKSKGPTGTVTQPVPAAELAQGVAHSMRK